MATGTIKQDVPMETIAPSVYSDKIIFRKYGKLVMCDVINWTVTQGQTGQTVPMELRPSYSTVYSTACAENSGLVAFRYNEGYLQFLIPDLTSYTTGTMYGHIEWLLD